MADDKTPKEPDQSGAAHGWAALGYLIAGIGVWGFGGYLVDQWLDLPNIGLMVGMMLGAGAGIYLIIKRMSTL